MSLGNASAAASADAKPDRPSSAADRENERRACGRSSQKEAACIGVPLFRNATTSRYSDRVKDPVDVVAPRDCDPLPPRRRHGECDRCTALDDDAVLGEVPPGRLQGPIGSHKGGRNRYCPEDEPLTGVGKPRGVDDLAAGDRPLRSSSRACECSLCSYAADDDQAEDLADDLLIRRVRSERCFLRLRH